MPKSVLSIQLTTGGSLPGYRISVENGSDEGRRGIGKGWQKETCASQSCAEVLATFVTFLCCVQSVSLTRAHWGTCHALRKLKICTK
jgi:hypothetical protein